MAETVILSAGVLHEAQAPAIRIGTILQDARRTFRRRGGADDLVEISTEGIRLTSKPGSRARFDIRLSRDAIDDVWVERGWLQRHLWLQVADERHGLAFRRRADLDRAVNAVRDLLGIPPR